MPVAVMPSAAAHPAAPAARLATLVMQSSGYAPAVRSGGVSDAWSRLYQVDDWFVDLMLRPESGGALLQGQLLADGDLARAPVDISLTRDGVAVGRCEADAEGGFDLRLAQPGCYRLEVAFGSERLAMPDIEVR